MLVSLVYLDRLIGARDVVHVGHAGLVGCRSIRVAVQQTDGYATLPSVCEFCNDGLSLRVFVKVALSTVSVNAFKNAMPVAMRSLPV